MSRWFCTCMCVCFNKNTTTEFPISLCDAISQSDYVNRSVVWMVQVCVRPSTQLHIIIKKPIHPHNRANTCEYFKNTSILMISGFTQQFPLEKPPALLVARNQCCTWLHTRNKHTLGHGNQSSHPNLPFSRVLNTNVPSPLPSLPHEPVVLPQHLQSQTTYPSMPMSTPPLNARSCYTPNMYYVERKKWIILV